ncbi:unnamed protein product [Rhizoctonia solani]|uniref:Uncharacterized protein n=1 Tax=Rhizoctonia solani TaxID=456999 RepID=A0A8H3BQS5_9AGAM|nr:unnamed protein product [Rhizoctonia solani]
MDELVTASPSSYEKYLSILFQHITPESLTQFALRSKYTDYFSGGRGFLKANDDPDPDWTRMNLRMDLPWEQYENILSHVAVLRLAGPCALLPKLLRWLVPGSKPLQLALATQDSVDPLSHPALRFNEAGLLSFLSHAQLTRVCGKRTRIKSAIRLLEQSPSIEELSISHTSFNSPQLGRPRSNRWVAQHTHVYGRNDHLP